MVNQSPEEPLISNENISNDLRDEKLTSGLSLESASYIENTLEQETDQKVAQDPKEESINFSNAPGEEYTPKLFSDDAESVEKEILENKTETNDNLFEEEINEDDDFEIPAFLRRQKF
mgnify:FL=1